MDPTLELVAQWIAGLTAVGGFLRVAKKKAYEPSKVFISRVGQTMDFVEQISKELGPNGGASIKDSVTRIDRRTLMTDARQEALIAAQPDPIFSADVEGQFTSANRALEDLTGFSRAHLTGMEWVNAIHPEDRFRIVQAWLHAVKDRRAWLDNCRVLTNAGRVVLVRIEAHPMRESIGERNVVGWHGILCVEART